MRRDLTLEEMVDLFRGQAERAPQETADMMRRQLRTFMDMVDAIHSAERRLKRMEMQRGITAATTAARAMDRATPKRDLSGYVDGRAVGGVDLGGLPCSLYAKLGGKL